MATAVCDGFGAAPGIFLIGNPLSRDDYEPGLQHLSPNQPPANGTIAGYFCHRVGRGDTEGQLLRTIPALINGILTFKMWESPGKSV